MKTQYGLYCIYDADIQAFIPDTMSVFISDELACKALANALFKMEPQARSAWASRRFYRVGYFDVAVVPPAAQELTPEVSNLLTALCSIPDKESDDVQHKV